MRDGVGGMNGGGGVWGGGGGTKPDGAGSSLQHPSIPTYDIESLIDNAIIRCKRY